MNIYDKIYAALEQSNYVDAEGHIRDLQKYDKEEAARLMVSLHIEQGDSKGAMEAWNKLRAILPGDFYTSFLYARILFMEKRYVSAYEELTCIVVPRDKQWGYGEKVANLLGQCCRILGKTDEAAVAYKRAAELAEDPWLSAMEYSNYLFNLHYSGHHTADFLRQAAAGFDRQLHIQSSFIHKKHSVDILRIGYISSDFRRHVLLCFCYGLLTAYNRNRFAVYVYMLGVEDEYSNHLRQQVSGWRNLRGLSPSKSAQIIYEDKIDILVDLSGHTKGNGLPILAFKPAPVQISGIGYFASTGLKTVDYFLGDVYLDGEAGALGEPEFTEELLIFPRSHFCYTPMQIVSLPLTPPYRRNGYVTFGSFNNFAKITDEVLQVWGRILTAVPHSHLLLKAAVFNGGETESYTKMRMARLGLPMERVECRGLSDNYLSEYGDMDIALDTFPYPGGGTSCDALYMGRPLITLAGKSHGGRFGYSLLMNLGLGELVAFTPEEYVERAVMLAGDGELLTALQINLRGIMERSPLMDVPSYLQAMETAFTTVWDKYEGMKEE